MNLHHNQSTPVCPDMWYNSIVPVPTRFKIGIEEPSGYTTIDGRVISHEDCQEAVTKGAGIFIGDYFVGLDEK